MTVLRPAPRVGVIDDGDVVYAASLPDGPIVVLEGVAALIWTEACGGERATVADRVAAATDATAAEVRAHVDAFVDQLLARGLLEPGAE
jgi:hypothetical protein